MNQLDSIANDAHDDEADADGLRDLEEFALVGLCAAVEELHSILDELLRHIREFLELVGHCGCACDYGGTRDADYSSVGRRSRGRFVRGVVVLRRYGNK